MFRIWNDGAMLRRELGRGAVVIDLNDYFYFVQIVEKQGISAAASALAMPKSRLSRHLRQLEERLGVVLIQRTSRQFHITDAGLKLYQHARALIDEMELAEAAMQNKTNQLSGNIRFSCSVGVAQFALRHLIIQFMQANPMVQLSQQVTNQEIDIVATGVDIAIRGHIDPLPDSSLIQRHLASVPWHLFASEAYLARKGIPESPYELAMLESLKVGWQSAQGEWNLHNETGLNVTISHNPVLCCDDIGSLKQAAVQGLGVVALPAYTCREEVRSKTLVRVLPAWHVGEAELTLLMPSRRGLTPQVQALRDFLLHNVNAYLQL